MASKKPQVRKPRFELVEDIDAGSLIVDRLYDEAMPVAAGPKQIEEPSKLRSLADSGLALGSGAVTGVKMISDAFGADNAVSRTLGDVGQGMQGLLSPYRQAEMQERQRLIAEAEASGSTLNEIGAYLGGFAEAPIDTLLNAAGTMAPTMAAMLVPGAREARLAAMLGTGVGAVQGAGAGKSSIYDAVLQRSIQEGKTEEEARALADEAQAYGGKNTDTILANAALGGVAGGSGLERVARGLKFGAQAGQAVPGMARRVGAGALAEGIPEAGQGGLEQLSGNVALQREGYDDVPTMRGVAGSAALEGVAGGALGGGFGIPTPSPAAANTPPAPAPIVPESGPLTRAANKVTAKPLELGYNGRVEDVLIPAEDGTLRVQTPDERDAIAAEKQRRIDLGLDQPVRRPRQEPTTIEAAPGDVREVDPETGEVAAPVVAQAEPPAAPTSPAFASLGDADDYVNAQIKRGGAAFGVPIEQEDGSIGLVPKGDPRYTQAVKDRLARRKARNGAANVRPGQPVEPEPADAGAVPGDPGALAQPAADESGGAAGAGPSVGAADDGAGPSATGRGSGDDALTPTDKPKPAKAKKAPAAELPMGQGPAPRTVTVNGKTVALTPEQGAEWDKTEAEFKTRFDQAKQNYERAKNAPRRADEDPDVGARSAKEQYDATSKRLGMELAAARRKIAGAQTQKETAKAEKDKAAFKTGDTVQTPDGVGKVEGTPFGRVRVNVEGKSKPYPRNQVTKTDAAEQTAGLPLDDGAQAPQAPATEAGAAAGGDAGGASQQPVDAGAGSAPVEADGVKRRTPKSNSDALEALEAGERIVLNEGTEFEEEIWLDKSKDGRTYTVKSKGKNGTTTFTKGPTGADRQWGWGRGDAAREAIKGKTIGEPLGPRSDSQAVNDYLDGKRDKPPTMDEVVAEGQADDTMADPEMAAYEGGKSSKTRAQDKAKVAEDAARAKASAKASANTVFTEDAAAAARARLKAKLNGGNKQRGGIDPEVFSDGVILAGYHIEKGARKFAAYVKAMLEDMGDSVKPYLKAWYMGVKFDPRGASLEGMDSAADVEAADVDAIASQELKQPAQPPAAPPQDDKPKLDGSNGRRAVAQSVADHLIGGNKFATIVEARKFIAELTGQKIEPGTRLAKLADETVEMGVAMAARDIVRAARKQGRSDEVIYQRLVALSEAQPSLNVRDSDSIREQAYSTPVPLAFVASRLAQIQPGQKVGEPTAGNGMLVMEVDYKDATLNELNSARRDNLEVMGFDGVNNKNAAGHALAPAKSLDAVVMNPPFGVVRDDDGKTVTYTVMPNYTTGEIDHAIVFKALEAMKDDGNAVLIIGGTLAESDEGRKDAYRGKSKREFFYNLHQQYNVVDHFTAGGDLYKKQGTTYPVDVIVIRGRGKSSLGLPAANLPPIIETWAQLKEKLNAKFDGLGARGNGDAGSDRGQGGNAADDSRVPEPAGLPTQGAGAAGQPGGTGAGIGNADAGGDDGSADRPGSGRDAAAVGEPGDAGAASGSGRAGTAAGTDSAQQPGGGERAGSNAAGVGDGNGRPADRARLSEEDAGKLQAKYTNFSQNKSVNTLVATNHLSALESAFARLRERVGNIDDYVRSKLQYDEAGFKKAFSAEQVEALALAIDNIEQGRGFIIGDQTGIGKGRVVAAMIRYAKLNGKTPVFVTQMPDLYGDMMRDLNDIGMQDFKPLMTNNNATVPLDADALAWFGEVHGTNTRIAELEQAITELVLAEQAGKDLSADVLAVEVRKAMKASANPEIVSLRDEIAELRESRPVKRGKFLETPNIKQHEKTLADIVAAGSIGDYGAIFTTYNQMAALDSGKPRRDKDGNKVAPKPAEFAYRDTFLRSMVDGNAMVILDESHNAGEAGDGKFPKVGDVVRALVGKAGGVFYSSATFAKNPAVMDVYSRTDLGLAFESQAALAEAINSVPLQQVASAMLVEAGQYIRRERSFDGIEYKIDTVEASTQAAEDVATAMRLTVEFDEAKQGALNDIQANLDAEGAVIASTGGGGSAGAVESTNFTSVMHNVINTFLLALKADAAADAAIAAIQAGEKPVLTVANTMEMFITEYARSEGLAMGDALNATFADVLMRYLEKTRMARIRHANGTEETVRLSDKELGPDAVAVFESAREFIASLKLDIPLSPIDHIKERIQAAGYSIGEITGRQTVVADGALKPRNKAELNTAGKKNTIAKFNGGQIDALIINRSGSTGLSMHASETFADQRRRVMVIAQAELDINNHMQMLGRINRTGQVTAAPAKLPKGPAAYGLPRYVQLTANVPIELRPAAVLAAKMASLSANTTAGRKSAVEDSSAPDFMNKYGDQVAALVIGNDPDLNIRLGRPIKLDEDGVPSSNNAIARVTGRIGLLPLREQTAIYDRIASEYRDLIAQLDALGKNDLEAKTYPLDAKTLEQEEVIAGEGDSPFQAPVIAEKVDVRKLGKPFESAKVRELIEQGLEGKTSDQHYRDLLDGFNADLRNEITALTLEAQADPKAGAVIDRRKEAMKAAAARFREVAPRLGQPVVIKTNEGNVYGVPVAIERKKGAKSVAALSSWRVKYAVVDGARMMTFPLSQVYSDNTKGAAESSVVIQPAATMHVANAERTGFDQVPVMEAFDRGQTGSRETRTVLTGNLLRAGGRFPGRLISYTTSDGTVRQGLMTPATFDLSAAKARLTPVLKDADQMVDFLDRGGVIVDRETGGEILKIRKTHRYEVTTAKSGKGKAIATQGGLYMVSSGSKMRANLYASEAAVLNDFLRKVSGGMGVALTTTSETKDLIAGDAKFSRRPAGRGLTRRDAQAATDLIRAQLPGAPDIILLDRVDDAPPGLAAQIKAKGAAGDVEAAYWDGKIYAFPGNFESLDRFIFVVGRHEVRHAGLDAMLGDQKDATMVSIGRANRRVMLEARKLMSDGIADSFAEAIEEVMADTPVEDIAALSRIRVMVAAIRRWLRSTAQKLRKAGWNRLADSIEPRTWSDNDVIAFVMKAEDMSRGPRGGGGARFSRAKTVANDDGHPEFEFDGIKLAFPIPTDRIEVIPVDGQQVLSYAVMPAQGFDVLGHVDVLLEDGRPVSLLDIVVYKKGNGVGGKAVEALLRAYPDQDLNISNIVPEAQGFWERMGVPTQNLEEGAAYDGTLNIETFLDAQESRSAQARAGRAGGQGQGANTGAARRAFGAVQAGQGGQGPAVARFSRPRTLDNVREAAFRSKDAIKDLNLMAGYKVGDFFESTARLSWWDKSVGTPYNLAKRFPGTFGKAYDAVQSFLSDVSFYATESANLAPSLLPKLDSLKDIGKTAIRPEDNTAIAAPIFEGTLVWMRDPQGKPVKVEDALKEVEGMDAQDKAQALIAAKRLDPKVLRMWQGLPLDQFEKNIHSRYVSEFLKPGVVWTDAELRSRFKLTDAQIGYYKEFRKATDKSLDDLTISEISRLVRGELQALPVADTADDFAMAVRDALFEQGANGTADRVTLMANRLKELKAQGYAPLSRFGHYTLDVVQDGERLYFGMYESQAEANRAARKMAEQFPGADISQGTQSTEAYKQFAGVTPETLELFGEILGLDAGGDSASDKAFQEYLKRAKSTRSAMKRLIHRKGIAGFSEDVGRVLAGFITSNARRTSSNHNLKAIGEAVEAIPKQQGELKDYAARMADYVSNPIEEAQAFRGLMFAQYLGGSIASALVNMTQPIAVTMPYLSQFGGAKKAAAAVSKAFADMAGRKKLEAGLAEAIARAEEDGIVAPQEIHQLQAQARGAGGLQSGDGTMAGNAAAKASNAMAKASLAWGRLFGFAELVNRRATFIAAYRVAVANGNPNPAKFAADAVTETQFTYNKGNRPEWARGAIGATLFTFKTYSISYVELLARQWKLGGPEGKKAFWLGLAVLMLMGGTDELPFMEDAEDLIDGVMQSAMGQSWQTKAKRREFLVDALGEDAARFLARGVSGLPGVPLDISGRLGMGNLIPGTGLLRKDQTTNDRDWAEIAGPAADLVQRGFKATGLAARGELGQAAEQLLPVAARNVIKADDMLGAGMYRDAKGKKVIDTTATEALLKGIGFQPATVARVQEAAGTAQRMTALNKVVEAEIADQWAIGRFEGDPAKVEKARNRLKQWNADNPDAPIRIQMSQVMKRIKKMRETKAERLAATAPKEIRAEVRRQLEPQ